MSEVLDEDPVHRLALVAWHAAPEFSDLKQAHGLHQAPLLVFLGSHGRLQSAAGWPGLKGRVALSVVPCMWSLWLLQAPSLGSGRVGGGVTSGLAQYPFCHCPRPPQPSFRGRREGPRLFTGDDVKLYRQGEKTQAGGDTHTARSAPRIRIKIKAEDFLAEKFWSFACLPFTSQAFRFVPGAEKYGIACS